MDYPWATHESSLEPMGYPMVTVGNSWATHGLRMGYPWATHGLPLTHKVSMDCPLAAHWPRANNDWKPVGCPRATHGLHMTYT